MTRKAYRLAYTAAVLVSWLFVVSLAAEVFALWRVRVDDYRSSQLRSRMQALVNEKEQQVIAEYARAPVKTGTDIEARESFENLNREERAAFAARRGEVVLLCSGGGEILECHMPEAPAAVVELGQKFRDGADLASVLPETEARDAMAALLQAGTDGRVQFREYEVRLSFHPRYVAQFTFQPFHGQEPQPQRVGIFIRESMWEELWVSFRPNVYQNDAYEFRTNNLGFRDDDVALPKPAGVIRILCIGASTTAEGPTNELTYPNMLEKKLERRFGEGRVEVVNCGIFAITSVIEREKMPAYLALEPDLIIHYNFVNDVVVGMRDLLLAAGASRHPVEKLKGLLLRSRFLYRYANWWLQPRRTIEDYVAQVSVENVRQMGETARNAGVEFVACSFAHPDLGRIEADHRAFFESCIGNMLWGHVMDIATYTRIVDRYNNAVRELCTGEGIPYVPVAENLRGGAEYFTDICHMNLVAMEKKAEIVFEHIEKLVAGRVEGQSGDAR